MRVWHAGLWGAAWVGMLLSSMAHGEDWPHWRGPQRNGISAEKGWKADWGTTAAPVAWKKSIGTGYSTVSVVNERLYTMGHAQGKETLLCLDANTGAVLWSHSYPAELVDNLHKGGPSSTPTVAGKSVYALSKDGRLMAHDAATGKLEWEQQLVGKTAPKVPEWGFSSSVVVVGEQLLVESGGVAAFAKATGELQWHAGRYKLGYGSPELLNVGGRAFVASLNNENVQIVDLASGREVTTSEWRTSFDTNSTTPIAVGDQLFISTGYKRGCELLKFDGTALTQVYENTNLANHMNNSVLWEGHLYGVNGNSHNPSQCSLRCIDWKTGELKWSQRGCGAGSLIVSDGKLLVLSDRGLLTLVKAQPSAYEQLAEQQVLEGECWTSPVLANGRIYCRSSDGELVCLDVQ